MKTQIGLGVLSIPAAFDTLGLIPGIISLLVIGLVGGLDPKWLAQAAPWWILEVTALGACCAAGWRAFRMVEPLAASRQLAHALTFACATLGAAALVEVALT